MFISAESYQGSVDFHDGWRIDVYRSTKVLPAPLKAAKALARAEYLKAYGDIQKYLASEDALMDDNKKLHLVLLGPDRSLQGYQLLYGDGPSPMPMEVLHPQVEIRFGSQNIFEVKRAVSLGKKRYPLFLQALATYINEKYQSEHNIPEDHTIVGYSVNKTVVNYLVSLGFEVVNTVDHQMWIRYPTRAMVAAYRGCPWQVYK